MTDLNKQKVLEKYPDSYCTGIWGLNGFYIARIAEDDQLVLNGGATEEEAWANAARRLEQPPTLPSNQENPL